MQNVCPKRATELSSIFGDEIYYRYRALKDFEFQGKTYIPKDTVMIGRFVKRGDVWEWQSPAFVPVKGPTQDLYLYNPINGRTPSEMDFP